MRRNFFVLAILALLVACHGGGGAVPPTAKSTPTSTPPLLGASQTPAYCTNYSNWPTTGVPVNITDNAALTGSVLIVYAENGSKWLGNDGKYDSAGAVPIAAACFKTTSGVTAKQSLYIPSAVSGWRIYLAYATPNPSSAPATQVPNPFGTVSISGPNPGYAGASYPWGLVEGGTTGGATIDTSQVEDLGLPIELSVGATPLPAATPVPGTCATSPPGTVGVTSCKYQQIFTAMEALPRYKPLVVTRHFPAGGPVIDMQVVSPNGAFAYTSFDWNLFANTKPPSTECAGSGNYLHCVLLEYKKAPKVFAASNALGVTGTSGDYYCVSSNGSTYFLFTDTGKTAACPSPYPTNAPSPAPTPKVHLMTVSLFTYGQAPAKDDAGCSYNILFSQPFGNTWVGSGHLFATADAFAIWKAMTADLNRGQMLQNGTHPQGLTNPSMSSFFHDPMYNQYEYVLHKYFNGNLAYATAYDDTGNWESGVVWNTGDPINIRINAVPASSQAPYPGSNPVPVPNPSTCPAWRAGIGGSF